MEINSAAFAQFLRSALLGVKVVLSCLARQNLSGLGDLEAFRVGFVGFHRHIRSFPASGLGCIYYGFI